MDRAKKLKASKIFYRLRTLFSKLNAVHRRACHAAMCRTNLPPTKPFSKYSRASTPLDLPSDPSDAPNEQELYELALATVSEHASSARESSNNQAAPIASATNCTSCYDHAPYGSSLTPNGLIPEASSSVTPDHLTPEASLSPEQLALDSLLAALDELIADLNSALQSARDHRSYWLQNRFTTLRRSVKALRKRTTAFTYSSNISPCGSHPEPAPKTSPDLPTVETPTAYSLYSPCGSHPFATNNTRR